MYKKLFISIVLILSVIFSFGICLANDGLQNAADGVRNIVGGAENAVEGAAKDISNASKNATGAMENGANNAGNTVRDGANNVGNAVKDGTNRVQNTMTNNGTYNATRTSTNAGNTFMGMNATAWTWLIIGIAAIAIVALVWYYSMQLRSSDYDNRD